MVDSRQCSLDDDVGRSSFLRSRLLRSLTCLLVRVRPTLYGRVKSLRCIFSSSLNFPRPAVSVGMARSAVLVRRKMAIAVVEAVVDSFHTPSREDDDDDSDNVNETADLIVPLPLAAGTSQSMTMQKSPVSLLPPDWPYSPS